MTQERLIFCTSLLHAFLASHFLHFPPIAQSSLSFCKKICTGSRFARKSVQSVGGSSRPCLLPSLLHVVVYMGPRASLLYPYEDPWRASAFIFAFTQLLFTVLVLVHTILLCITSLLMKWYEWWLPSCRDGVYRSGASVRFDSCVTKKPFNLDCNASRSSPFISTERFLKHSRSEDGWSVKNKPLICPKCHGVWTFKQSLSSKYDKGAATQWGETSTCLDASNSSGNYACGTKMYNAVDKLVPMNPCTETTNYAEESSNNACGTKTYDDVDNLQTTASAEESVGNGDGPPASTKWSQTPVQGSHRPVNEEIMGAIFTERPGDEAGSSSKKLRGDGLNRVCSKIGGSSMHCNKLKTSEMTPYLIKELEDEFVDEELSVFMSSKDDNKDYDCENMNLGSRDQQLSFVVRKKDGSKEYECESVIKGLGVAIQKERKKLCALYAELEVERIASETAANEAMSMISRLQEEKAALCMHAAHYQRMVEEKAIYDDQAMELLKEILYRKERENYLLEKEVKVMRTRFCKDVRKFGKRRKGVDRTTFFAEGKGTLLLKNVEEVSNLSEGHDMRDGVQEVETNSSFNMLGSGVEKPPCPFRITEEQPFKRLKGNINPENGICQSVLLASDTAHLHHYTDFALVGANELAQSYVSDSDSLSQYSFPLKEGSEESQPSDSATIGSDRARVLNSRLQEQKIKEITEDSEGRYCLSQYEIMTDSTGDRYIFSGDLVPLNLDRSASSAMDSVLESCQFVADKKSQDLYSEERGEARSLPLHRVSKELNQSGECLHKATEIVCPNKGTSCGQDSFTTHSSNGIVTIMSSSEPSSNKATYVSIGQETQDQAGAEFVQSTNFDLKDSTRKDLQARLQNFESDKTPQSCPSSLNHKGSGINKFGESDSSLMRNHVY